MNHRTISFALALACLAGVASGQFMTITNTSPGTFVDISTTGGTALPNVTDDSSHVINTTIGNAIFPAGTVTVNNNGWACSGVAAGAGYYTNNAIPATGLPTGMIAGSNGILMPFWDDLYPVAALANTTLWWQELNNRLYIMWKDDGHIVSVAGQTVTFEIIVYPQGGPYYAQFIYTDTVFGGTHAAYDNGLSATIGYAMGNNATPLLTNVQWSFNTASISNSTVLTLASPGPPPPPEWQVNQAGSTFNLDGVTGSAYSNAVVTRTADNACTYGQVTVNQTSTNLNLPWDLGVTNSNAVGASAGGFYTNNNIVNVNFADPTLTFLLGLTFTSPFVNASYPFAPGGPFDAAGQQVVLNGGTNADGFDLSQAVTFHVTAVTPGVAGPTGDDAFLTYTLGAGPLCLAAPMAFYGTVYSQVHVTTNGRMMMNGAASTTWTPSVAGAMAAPGTFGVWCDLNQGAGGSISVTTPAPGLFRATWNAVPYFTTTIPNTYSLELDTSSGNMTISGIPGIVTNATVPTANQFMGISKGAGATDPGAINFASVIGTGLQAGPGGAGMIYAFGLEGTLAPGVASIVFLPDGTNNYNFAVF